MPASAKSSVVDSLKPLNVFYVWYAELCRRYNTSPLSVVRPAKPKKETVLDFVGDRVKAEEWAPIVNALKKDMSLHVIAVRSRAECEFLDDIDSEQKMRRMKRRFGSLRTAFVLRMVLKSLAGCLRCTQVLTSLELDGLFMNRDYLQLLVPALELNKTLKILSLKHCPLGDGGCELLCRTLRYASNIEVLDLTGCRLGVQSAENLAKLINYQQTKRYCECWHNSLRYEDPEVEIMCGLRRLTLNGNPDIGDEGLCHVLDVLADDLWIKAIDLQKCNITDEISGRIVEVVTYNRSLQIVDLRHNGRLSGITIDKVFEILKTRQQYDLDNEYNWCLTTSTLMSFASELPNETSPSDFASVVQKSRSAPEQKSRETNRTGDSTLRRSKTLVTIKKLQSQIGAGAKAQKAVTELDKKLREETTKRKQVEHLNHVLQRKLDTIRSSSGDVHKGTADKSGRMCDPSDGVGASQSRTKSKNKLSPIREGRGKSAVADKTRPKERTKRTNSVGRLFQLVFPASRRDSAQNLFEKLIAKDSGAGVEDSGDEETAERFYKDKILKADHGGKSSTTLEAADEENLSASNVSLLKMLDEINSQVYVTT